MRLITGIILTLAAMAASETTAFEFVIPAGWRDLSASAPADNFRGIPDAIVREATQGGYAAFAVDPVAGPNESHATFGAKVVSEVNVVSAKFLEGVIESAAASIAHQGLHYKVHEQRLDKINGAAVGRYVADLTDASGGVRQLVYVVPGRGETALLVYSAVPEQFDTYLPVFEAAAHGAKGVEAPSRLRWLFTSDRGHYILGRIAGYALGGLLGVIVIRRLMRR